MLVHPNFDPVAVHLGPIAIRWYGLMYLVGFAIAFWLGRLRIARANTRVTYAILDDLLFFVVLGVVFGGRLGYVLFYKPGYYFSNPLEILAVWHGMISTSRHPVRRASRLPSCISSCLVQQRPPSRT